ncbi:hypothetical protein [Actinomycetospora soli]|uniref:hypothetical protein n=1 Tax=Actinomycetospora soli TaxID=2893887 RepID=UPI001E3A94D1|nr:hypothetical protein [Actinomycetospora soli]MCD2190173.1 hypothetical protein [Actinomycetospora soli]
MRAGRAALTTLAGASALWLAAPLVALVRHGSIDDRTRAAWAGEGAATPATPTTTAAPTAPTTATAPLAPVLPLRPVPAPRPAADDLLPRGRTTPVRPATRGTG